jgi:hypothetical protein
VSFGAHALGSTPNTLSKGRVVPDSLVPHTVFALTTIFGRGEEKGYFSTMKIPFSIVPGMIFLAAVTATGYFPAIRWGSWP